MQSRRILLASASALVLGFILTTPPQANAASCVPVNGTISGACLNYSNSATLPSLTNAGTINGVTSGIYNNGSIGTLTNTGTISANAAIYNDTIGTITSLNNSAAISGNTFGLSNGGTIATLTNSGTISASHPTGALAINNTGLIGTLTNTGAIAAGSTQTAIGVSNSGSIGILTNRGTITATGPANGYGIYNNGSIGSLGNVAGALIQGNSIAVDNDTGGSIGTLNNDGTISGIKGISNSTTGSTIGTLTNSGSISGGYSGIYNGGGIGTLTNSGTISGGNIGILNSGGTIGTLNNSGTISASGVSAIGIFNQGSIGTLTNSGTISARGSSAIGIGNAGSIGTLSNSGTISGGQYAIYNANTGSLGPITNSGVIAGNIYNGSSNDLTINGGSGSTFGTLTGFTPGSAGTISNTSSNLLFATGNILLQDNVDVTGHSLNVTGATVKLTSAVTPTITGTYNQTGGGLLIATSSGGTSYGHMSVTGNATVNGSQITISGSGLSSGETFTIVHSGATGSYTNDTASVSGTSDMTASVSTVGQDLVVTLAGGTTYHSTGATTGSAGGAIGSALDQIAGSSSPQAQAFQQNVLTPLNNLPAAQQAAAIKSLGPTQNAPSSQMSSTAATAVLGAVEQHQQTAMAYDGQTGVAAGSDTHDTALWGQMLGGGAVRGTTASADGYKTRDFGLATGIDHSFTPNAMAGVAFSWIRGWSDGLASSGSSSTLDSYQLTLYGTYRQGPAFVDGQLGAGYNSFSQKRSIAFLGQTAEASYGGEQYLGRVLAGYDVPVSGVTVTPLAGLTTLRSVSDAYTETGSSDNLSVGRRGVNAVSHDLGGQVSWTTPTALGALKPEVRAEWVHDYTQGAIPTSGVIGGTATFATSTQRPVADGARIGLAATLTSDDAVSVRTEYDGELRAKYQSHTGLVKVLWSF